MNTCPNCTHSALEPFYEVHNIPVHSVLLIRDQKKARTFPRGDLHLAVCTHCGFITNTAFDASLLQYSHAYEETQGFSPTFSAFHRRLAQMLIRRHHLYNKRIIEIGCGKGEFLTLLCEEGNNEGIGFDPAYVPGRIPPPERGKVTFIEDFYSQKYASFTADFICCKMTLEHIPHTAHFLRTVRQAIGNALNTRVFFQIPETLRILKEEAFWDLYYEHCSYFSPVSLRYLFESQGFQVADLWTDYDDQYLMIDALPSPPPYPEATVQPEELRQLLHAVQVFRQHIPDKLHQWRDWLASMRQQEKKIMLWGGGSKAVAFLTTLGLTDEVMGAVDINPFKRNTFLPGSGHQVYSPDDLPLLKPDVVLVMNPIYTSEIKQMLQEKGLHPVLQPVTEPLPH